MVGERWSEDEERELVRLLGEGLTTAQAGQKLGRTAGAVEMRVRLLRGPVAPPARPWTSAEVARLVEMRRQGASVAEVAAALGRTPRATKRRVVELQATFNAPDWTTAEVEELIRLRRADVSRAECARRLGRTESSVKDQIQALKITYECRTCQQMKPGPAFAWHRGRRLECHACRKTAESQRERTRARTQGKVRLDDLRPAAHVARLRTALASSGEVHEVAEAPEGHRRVELLRAGGTFWVRCACGQVSIPGMREQLVWDDHAEHVRSVQRDEGRQERVTLLQRQLLAGTFRFPTTDEWMARFRADPELAGAMLHDVAQQHLVAEGAYAGRIGRLPHELDHELALGALPVSVRAALEADGILVGR